MAVASLVVSVLAVVISLVAAYASWRAVRPKPRITGSITSAWHFAAGYAGGGEAGVVVLLHVVLTNASAHPVHLLGYRLQVEADRWYDTQRLQNMVFTLPPMYLSNGRFIATLSQENLLDWPPKPVTYGAPLMGFLMFLLPGPVEEDLVARYRLIVTDVFGREWHFDRTDAAARAWQEQDSSFNVVELFRYAGAKVEAASTPRKAAEGAANSTSAAS